MPSASDKFPKVPSSKVAVLTGDVVGSTRSSSKPQELLDSLNEAARAVKTALPDVALSAIDIFRGDSWQMLVGASSHALRAAVLFRAHLCGGEARDGQSWDTRVGIGIGSVESLDWDHISQSQGEAFIASGEALDRLEKSKCRLGLIGLKAKDQAAADVVMILLDALIQRWTAKQAWAVYGALRDLTQEQIGREFVPPLQQRTVADHLDKADWSAVESVLQWWEKGFR